MQIVSNIILIGLIVLLIGVILWQNFIKAEFEYQYPEERGTLDERVDITP